MVYDADANTTTGTTDHLTPASEILRAKNVRLGRKLADRMTQDKLAKLIGVRDYNESIQPSYEHAHAPPASIGTTGRDRNLAPQSLRKPGSGHAIDEAWNRAIDEDKP